MSSLTIAIVTRRRPELLSKCLSSLVKQTVLPQNILVVENDTQSKIEDVLKNFVNKISIVHVMEKREGVPYARNSALRNCKTKFIAFIDDDCVVEKNWVKEVLEKLKSYKKSYLIGRSLMLNEHSAVGQAKYRFTNYWFEQGVSQKRLHPSILDTKNVIFNLDILKKKNLSFDPNISIKGIDATDTDFGYLLASFGLDGEYEPRIVVNHMETNSIRAYLYKGYIKGKLSQLISEKWNLGADFYNRDIMRLDVFCKSIKNWPKEFHNYFSSSSMSYLDKVLSFSLIKIYEVIFSLGFKSLDRRLSHE